ncbi:MAG: hypothetical protein WA708_14605 [Acidobacteriaceae bacterium]
MNRTDRFGASVAIAMLAMPAWSAHAQAVAPAAVSAIVQQAQTVHIPLQAYQQGTALPVKDLQSQDLTLDIAGKPTAFQLSRPWAGTINPKTGQPDDRPNLLIVLPLGDPVPRNAALDQTIQAFSAQPQLGWNISILDDGGDQTVYTRDPKTVVAELEKLQMEAPAEIDLESWRRTAALAIADMRELPGRRVVLSLGDLFHETIFQNAQLVYENFEVQDVAAAARNAGATIYSADSFPEIESLRRLYPYYSVIGSGPWLMLTGGGHVAGWISNTVAETIQQIRQNGMGAYDLDLHLEWKQMNGHPRAVSVTPRRPHTILTAPPYYVAPDLPELQLLARLSPALRQALRTPPPVASSPLQLITQLEYFPHPDGKIGTQTMTTGFFWNQTIAPPAHLETALELAETNIGYIASEASRQVPWNTREPVWNAALRVVPGSYRLRVAAVDATGKIAAATSTSFSVEPGTNEPVLISSLVLGKSCVFAPTPNDATKAENVDYLRAGNCDLQPDPSHYYSPRDVIWTLVRITPVGKLASRPSKDWKASFLIIDAKGSKRAEEPVHWLPASDGSFVATTGFELSNPKLKLENGEYAVVFRMRGPGVEDNYAEDAPFMMYGAEEPPQH